MNNKGKRMKSRIKKILHKLGIISLFTHLFEYGLKTILKQKPYILNQLKSQFEEYESNQLLSKIKTKGSNIHIKGTVKITEPRSLILGNNVHIGDNCYFLTRAGISIGDNTHLSSNITLYSSSHNSKDGIVPYSSNHIDKPIHIADNVWIGMNVNILPGVTIGHGAIVGMGTTVAKDIGPGEIVVSQPFRVISQRNSEKYQCAVDSSMYGGVNGKRLNENECREFKVGLNHPNITPFFVLSTGRAGSTTIAKLLSQHNEVTCLHEPKFSLIRLSTEYLHKIKTKEQVLAELKTLFIDSHCHPLHIYGESDQKLSNMVHLLAELIPNAKFIWLIRQPDATVNSTFSRGWFSDNELGFTKLEKLEDPLYRGIFSDYRPQADKIGEMSNQQWVKMSSFERNCWYWNFWNQQIKDQLDSLNSERWMKVRLEELDNNIGEVLTFIGAEKTHLKPIIANVAEKKYQLKNNDDWNDDMKASYNRWCSTSGLY